MNKYRFYIDGAEQDQPDGWDQMSVVMERHPVYGGLFVTFTNELVFRGSGYALLKDRFDTDYNSQVICLIEEHDGTDYVELFNGVIILSDIKMNHDKKSAKVTVEDRSFQAAIQANQQIEVVINSGFSKNGVQLTSKTVYASTFFDFTTGAALGSTKQIFLLSDVLDYLVRFMSDDKVKGIASTYLTNDAQFGTDKLLFLTSGYTLRTGTLELNVSFKKLFELLKATHSLAFAFELDTNGDPVMRIEHEDYFFIADTGLNILNAKDLLESADTSKIYSAVTHGNRTWTSGVFDTTGWIDIFKDRQYFFRGTGNIDNVLDMTHEYITDSNVFEDIIMNSADTYDDDVLCVVAEADGLTIVRNSTPNYYLNKELTNSANLARVTNGLPNDLLKYLPGATAPALINATPEIKSFTSQCDPLLPVSDPQSCSSLGASCGSDFVPIFNPMDSEDYDLGNNYNDTERVYVLPLTGDFVINVFAQFKYYNSAGFSNHNTSWWQLDLWHLGVGVPFAPIQNNEIARYSAQDTGLEFTPTKQTASLQISQMISGTINERLGVSMGWVPNVCLNTGSTVNVELVEANFSITTADDYPDLSFNPLDYRARNLELEKPLSLEDFNTLRAAPFGQVNVGEGGSDTLRKTYINRLEHNRETSNTKLKLFR